MDDVSVPGFQLFIPKKLDFLFSLYQLAGWWAAQTLKELLELYQDLHNYANISKYLRANTSVRQYSL